MRRDLSIVANNVANAATTGFRGERTLFQEYLSRSGQIGRRENVSFTQDLGVFRDNREGPVQMTGNDFDLALRGDGFFAVGTPGQELYARTGQFHLDGNRQLLTSEGYALLGEGGGPIEIPPGAARIEITADGAVKVGADQIARVRVVRFEDEQTLRKAGVGLYTATTEPLPAPDTQIVQGALEGSNVQPILEIARMLDMQREYDSTQRLIEAENERQKTAISRLARAV